jgi:hypothetical protein
MRFVSDRRPVHRSVDVLTNFYRQEFLRHRECLEYQREYYSEQAISDVEAALSRIMAQLERLCANENVDQVMSRVLHKLDVVTGLSAFSTWSDQPPIRH